MKNDVNIRGCSSRYKRLVGNMLAKWLMSTYEDARLGRKGK